MQVLGGAVRYCGFGSSAEQVLLLLQIDAARLRQALAKQLFTGLWRSTSLCSCIWMGWRSL